MPGACYSSRSPCSGAAEGWEESGAAEEDGSEEDGFEEEGAEDGSTTGGFGAADELGDGLRARAQRCVFLLVRGPFTGRSRRQGPS